MKKRTSIMKRVIRWSLGLLAICSLTITSPQHIDTVYAKEKPKFDVDSSAWTVAPVSDDNVTGQKSIDIDAVAYNGAKAKKVRSSNKSVATAEASSWGLTITYGARTGSTVISCVVNGVKLSHRFTVKYVCPVASFKVGKKSVLSTFKKKNIFITSQTLQNETVTLKAKKGWVITNVRNAKNRSYKSKTFKNRTSHSTKITTKWPYDGITVELKNKKTGMVQTVTYRKKFDSAHAVAG